MEFDGSVFEYNIWAIDDAHSFTCHAVGAAETREQARYEAFKQAKDEIEKRLKDD